MPVLDTIETTDTQAPPPPWPAAAEASEVLALAGTDPRQARARVRAVLAGLTPEQCSVLTLLYRGHAHSPLAALARVIAYATHVTTGEEPTVPLYSLADAGAVPVAEELRGVRGRAEREPCHDLRLHAEPRPAIDIAPTTPAVIARVPARRYAA